MSSTAEQFWPIYTVCVSGYLYWKSGTHKPSVEGTKPSPLNQWWETIRHDVSYHRQHLYRTGVFPKLTAVYYQPNTLKATKNNYIK